LISAGEFCVSLGQPHGSERDSADDSAFHLFLLDGAGKALACRGLHLNAPGEAQVRYGDRCGRTRSRLGAPHPSGLEAETVFGVIRHMRMETSLS